MINTDNYELYFFQYQEDMLDESARREVEAFVALYPELAEEMTLYAEAPVLTAEEVSFPDKNSLRRTVAFPWWRYAAAAAAVLAVGTVSLMLLQSPAGQSPSQPLVAESHTPDTCQPDAAPVAPAKTLAAPVRAIAEPAAALQEPALAEAVQSVESAAEEPAWTAEEMMEAPITADAPEPLLAQVEVPAAQPRKVESQPTEIVYRDYSGTPWSELLADELAERYPEKAVQATAWTTKTMNAADRLLNNPIVKFIRSIV